MDRYAARGNGPSLSPSLCGQHKAGPRGGRMTARSLLTTVACFLFCAFLQFGGTLAPLPWVILAGGFSSAIFLLLMRFFDVELPRSWLRVLFASGASLAGV